MTTHSLTALLLIFHYIFIFQRDFGLVRSLDILSSSLYVHSNKNAPLSKIHCEHFSHEFPRADASLCCVNSYWTQSALNGNGELRKGQKKRVQIKHRNSENPKWTWLSIQQNECVCCIFKYFLALLFVSLHPLPTRSLVRCDRLPFFVANKATNTMARIIKLHKWKIEMS